jgi:hypothetical protein
MALGEILYQPGSQMRHAYFPTTAIVSLLNVTSDGSSAEIAIIGNEGIVGVALCMGSVTTLSYAIVQSAGYGVRLSGKHLTDEFARGGQVQHLLLHYTQALLTQNSANRAVQSASFLGAATMSLVASEPRSAALERTDHDARADCQHARSAPPGCH